MLVLLNVRKLFSSILLYPNIDQSCLYRKCQDSLVDRLYLPDFSCSRIVQIDLTFKFPLMLSMCARSLSENAPI